MNSKKNILILCSALLFNFSISALKSQTIHVCESTSTDGQLVGEKTKFKIDPMKENFVYILVNFPGAYGCNQIKFKRFLLGNPNPVSTMDVDPSAAWAVYEMYLPDQGEYTFTVYDCNDVEIGKTKITAVNK